MGAHMIALRSLALCSAAVLLIGCGKETTFSEPIPDYAAIHWINAVPDTGQQDMRVIDVPSNAGLFDANFRGSTMFYQPIQSGTRTVRIFNSSTNPTIASQVLQESTLNLAPDSGYTFIHAGFARTGSTPARTVLMIRDTPTNEDTGHVAIRAINAGAGLGPVDVWVAKRPVNAATGDSLPDTPAATNVAFGEATAYISTVRDGVATDTIRVIFATTGTKTVLASVVAPAGVAGSTTVNPIAGSRVGGSVLSAVLVPRSVAGSPGASPTNFTTPSTIYLVDKRPANTAP
jgi:hypothetical protein